MLHFSNITYLLEGAVVADLNLILNIHQIFQFVAVSYKTVFEVLELQKIFGWI
jgi:hypothetical protein